MRVWRALAAAVTVGTCWATLASSAYGVAITQHTVTGPPAQELVAWSGGLVATGSSPGASFGVLSTSPYKLTAGPSGPEAEIIGVGPTGTAWFLVKKTAKETVLYESSLTASPLAANAKYTFPSTYTGGPMSIIVDTTGAVWLAATPSMAIERFLPGASGFESIKLPFPATPTELAAAPEGGLWYIDTRGAVGHVTSSGEIQEFVIPPTQFAQGLSGLRSIAVDASGNAWFTQWTSQAIGRITPSGQISEYPIPNPKHLVVGVAGAPQPLDLAVGKEGAVWFTDPGDASIGEVNANGEVSEYPLPAPAKTTPPTPTPLPLKIALAPNGELWFTESINAFGSVNPSGATASSASSPSAVTSCYRRPKAKHGGKRISAHCSRAKRRKRGAHRAARKA
ncbi:MAG TPA: hypothetical protein VGF95_06290 [Solirubrobacteraceae bacterium]|jgi:streptogramin lyase